MRFISTRAHGFLDYAMGLLLIAAPWLFGFAAGGAETWVPVVLGAGAILYSLMTDYELGVAIHAPSANRAAKYTAAIRLLQELGALPHALPAPLQACVRSTQAATRGEVSGEFRVMAPSA